MCHITKRNTDKNNHTLLVRYADNADKSLNADRVSTGKMPSILMNYVRSVGSG